MTLAPMRPGDDSGSASGPDTEPEMGRPVQVWVVRADGGKYTDDFIAGGYVAIGWFDVSSVDSREEIRRLYEQEYPDARAGQIANEIGQLAGFRLEMAEGDYVITPAADRESLHYGCIIGPCVGVAADGVRDHSNRRAVKWTDTPLSRSTLAASLQGTLGSPRTVFRVHRREEFLAAIGYCEEFPHEAAGRSGASPQQAVVSALKDDVVTGITPAISLDPSRPVAGTETAKVWDLADEITREKGHLAERGEVVEGFAARGGNRNTASTTYYRWKQHHDAQSSALVESSVQRRGVAPKSTDVPPYEEDETEPDGGVEEEREDPDAAIEQPFDPSKIRVQTVPVLVDQLMARIRYGEVDLAPDFQRESGIWNDEKKSRLIESLLLRIPIPVFYVAANEEESWAVVDGVQRLSTIRDYVNGEFPLKRLEYRDEFDGRRYDDLPRSMQRRIGETQFVVNVIQPGTPPEVMFNIFRRINTGGMPLNGQEIRHALNPGPVRKYLKDLAQSNEFAEATDRSIGPKRMDDRACVLRFLAFHMERWEQYEGGSLDGHLERAMKAINAMAPERQRALAEDFRKAMRAARSIFGNDAFRRRKSPEHARRPISFALFETWSVQLARCTLEQIERLIERRGEVQDRFMTLLNTDQEFEKAISVSTGMSKRIRKRFEAIQELVQELI